MLTALTASKQHTAIKQWMPVIYPILLLACSSFFLYDYFKDMPLTLLAGLAAIVATTRKGVANKPQGFAVAALVMFTLVWLVPVKTLLYIAAGFVIFYWMETNIGRIHFLGVLAFFLASPAFQYAANVFSFPIRVQLTRLVGTLFSLVATGIELKGNVIFYGGQEFAVDPACMGIHMFSLSLLLGICLIGLLQRKAARMLSWKAAVFYLACLFLLNLLANVLRIVILVQFAIPPETAMHDIIGLLCLLLYVCVPACFLGKALVVKAATVTPVKLEAPRSLQYMHWLLFALMLLVAQRVATVDTFAKFNDKYPQAIKGYTSSVSAPGILKLENDQSLVYIKFIRGFYDTDHNPSMCWKGSGYTFAGIKKEILNGREVFTSSLQKNNEKLYTAWWYGNDQDIMTSQTDWRWKMLKGAQAYALINITANSEAALAAQMKTLLTEKTLQPLFNK